MKTVVIHKISHERRIAVLEDQKMVDFFIDRPTPFRVGNIFKGRVTKVLKGMDACFVDIGDEKNAYLPKSELASYHIASIDCEKKKMMTINEFVTEGEEVIVQIKKEKVQSKGAKVSTLLEWQGSFLIYLPMGGYVAISKKIIDESKRQLLKTYAKGLCTEHEGVIFRTASETAVCEQLKEEWYELKQKDVAMKKEAYRKKNPALLYAQPSLGMQMVRELMKEACEIIVDDLNDYHELQTYRMPFNELHLYNEKENIFSAYKIDRQLEKIFQRRIWLKSGGWIVVDQTEALTAIDVNTGKFVGKRTYEDTTLKTNIEAAKEIAYQLRLRNIGGMIIIDFIDMKTKEEQNQVINALKEALKNDKTSTFVLGFTRLGLLEMTRKRVRDDMFSIVSDPCPYCHGIGRRFSLNELARQLYDALLDCKATDDEAIWIEVSAELDECLNHQWNGIFQSFARNNHIAIIKTIHRDANEQPFMIRQLGQTNEIKSRIGNHLDFSIWS